MNERGGDDRGISDALGAVVLISVIALGITVAALSVLSGPLPREVPAVSADVTNTSDTVFIRHAGGDTLVRGEYRILADGADRTSAFLSGGTVPARWSVGEELRYRIPAGSEIPKSIQIIAITGGREQVILQVHIRPPDPAPTVTISPTVPISPATTSTTPATTATTAATTTATSIPTTATTAPTETTTTSTPAPRTIFSDNFDNGVTGWAGSGDVSPYSGTPHNGAAGVRLRSVGQLSRTIPTTGYSSVTVSFSMGAFSLEPGEYIAAEWSPDGSTWVILKEFPAGDPEVDNALHSSVYSLPPNAGNNSRFALRFRLAGNDNSDRGYVDDVIVSGTPA